jgi:uncharacterized protein YraI
MRLFASIIVLAAAWMAAPGAAHADPGFVASRTFAYAGPDESFPRVAYLRRGTRLEVRGCLERYDWCDVLWGRHRYDRGWVSEDMIDFYYRGRSWRSRDYFRFRRPAIVIWDIDRYWDDSYRSQRFFRQRESFRRLGSGHERHSNNDANGRGADRTGQNQVPNNNGRGANEQQGGALGDRGHDQQGPTHTEHGPDNRGGENRHGGHDENGASQTNGANQSGQPVDSHNTHSGGSSGHDQQPEHTHGTQPNSHPDSQSPTAESTQGHHRGHNQGNNSDNCPLNENHQPVCPSPH